MQGEKQTELLFVNAEIAFHQRHRQWEIGPHKIKSRIADNRREEHARLPVTIFGRDDLRVGELNFSGRCRAKRLQKFSEEAILRCSYCRFISHCECEPIAASS